MRAALRTVLVVPSTLLLSITASWVICPNSTQAQTLTAPTEIHAPTPLKPGDRIRLTVASFPDLSGEQMILADGTIQLPMAGNVAIGRLTATQAVERITEALRPYVRHPQVGLSVLSISPIRVSVTGEVLHPGPRLLSGGDSQDSKKADNAPKDSNPAILTLSEALVLAGGIKPNADLRRIVIRRIVPDNVASNTKTNIARTEVNVDLWQAIQTGNLGADPQIYDGDEIVVPTATANSADQQTLLASTIAPTKITVQVAGEVQRPGQIEIAPNAGVSAAVAAAGGLNDKARNSIELLRMSATGRLERQTFAFGEVSGPLMNGDVIIVKKSSFNNF